MNWAICGTRNAHQFLSIGSKILDRGGSALDAVEEVIKQVELNKEDWSVGFNGFPNLMGEIELDASIMIGSTRKAGSVAGIKKYVHAISIARKVMELSPHVMLIAEGAEKFAKAIGFKESEILSDQETGLFYQNVIEGKDLLDGIKVPQEVQDLAWRYDKYIANQLEKFDYKSWYRKFSHDYHGTVNVIALDKSEELVSGVSTSGLALKFPGRVGDTPIIGAGNYCDKKYGAAACVGTGELAIRLSLTSNVVNSLKNGKTVNESVEDGVKDLIELSEDGVIQILSMDAKGNVAACSNH